MTDQLAALIEQHAETGALLERLDATDWDRPVPRCPGWTVTDVVLHVAQTDELAIASVRGEFPTAFGEGSIDAAADAAVRAQRAAVAPDDVRARWSAAASELESALDTADPRARVQWVAGTLTARTLTTTRLAEAWIHTGDIADAVGVDLAPGDRLRHVARLAWRTLPYAFERAGRSLAGPVAFDLTGPSGGSWRFGVDEAPPAVTTITGSGVELCLVAARRVDPALTSLRGDGPDRAAVLELVRTYA